MKKSLFKLIILAFTAISISASAEEAKRPGGPADGAKKEERFAQIKQKYTQVTEKRIGILQSTLSCVNAATNHEQMKTCHEKERQAMKELGHGHKGPHGRPHGKPHGERPAKNESKPQQ